MKFWVVIFSLIVFGQAVEARVFHINRESFAPYVRATYALAWDNTTFSESSGANTTVDGQAASNTGGEFGFLYATPVLSFKFGLELMAPTKQKGIKGYDAADTELFSLDSESTLMIPKAGLEFNVQQWQQSRLFLLVGAGMANLTTKNTYDMTAAGTAALSANDYNEELKASALMYEASLGFETVLSDTTTWILEAGYRQLKFSELKHNKDATLIGGSSAEKGDVATKNDGDNRTLDMSGYYAGLSFRFYLF